MLISYREMFPLISLCSQTCDKTSKDTRKKKKKLALIKPPYYSTVIVKRNKKKEINLKNEPKLNIL